MSQIPSDISKANKLLYIRISTTGSSEYRLNDKVVSAQAYNAALAKHNILTKAKNFLVFQGDVEAVASQSPRDLTRLIEQISGSLELEKEYEAALVFVKQYKAKAKVTILDGRLKFMRMKKDAFAEGRLLVRGWGTRTWKEWRIGLKTEEGMKLAGFDVFSWHKKHMYDEVGSVTY